MSNPIQDLLDRLKGTTKTASGTTTTKPKATGTAGGGVGSATRSANVFQTSLQRQKEAIAKKTNQQIINAAYKVADELKLKGGPWPLLRAAGWGRLTEKRGDLYKGKAVDEIDKLTAEQKAALKRVLGL